MSSTREKKDLWLIISDPIEARKYLRNFDWKRPPELRPDKVVLESGRTIYFKTMSDDDAVVAAMAVLRDCEIPRVMRDKQFEQWEH